MQPAREPSGSLTSPGRSALELTGATSLSTEGETEAQGEAEGRSRGSDPWHHTAAASSGAFRPPHTPSPSEPAARPPTSHRQVAVLARCAPGAPS